MAGRDAVTNKRAAQRPPETDFPALRDYYTYDYEETILAGTWDAAYWAAQCALTAADCVLQGQLAAYALCRPPGHHASADHTAASATSNNAAIAARYLGTQTKKPVAILDVDYHHGNGTQSIFYADPSVLYCSLHADPALEYPHFWGYAAERGAGAGLGTNYNFPLPLYVDDAGYLAVLDEALSVIRAFKPGSLVVSWAGYGGGRPHRRLLPHARRVPRHRPAHRGVAPANGVMYKRGDTIWTRLGKMRWPC
jgi:acetoin utilization deacetylase AcuC-like enzyme